MRIVARLTGLTADTIRAWERRYGAVIPSRSDGNTRNFSAEDVRRLILLREVTAAGHTIKDVANLPEDELKRMIENSGAIYQIARTDNQKPAKENIYEEVIREYLSYVKSFDVKRAQRLLSRSAALINSGEFIFQVLIPILRQTGLLWYDSKITVAHEHLVSMQVRALLTKMMDFSANLPGATKILVTTPENHLHEFGALVGAFLAANRGMEPIYLGPNMPRNDLLQAIDTSKAHLLLLGVVREMLPSELKAFNEELALYSDKITTWVGMPEDHAAWNKTANVRYFSSFEQLDLALTRFNA